MAPSTRCLVSLLILVVVTTVASATEPAARQITPATAVMELPESMGTMERPAVEFNHAAHTTALAAEGCTACHTADESGLIPTLTATTGIEDRDELIDAFHGTCVGCHKKRAAAAETSGPITCGECHVKYESGVSQRLAMSFDYSLHGRHSLAFEDKCEACHHVYDEATEKLIYVKGKEEGCPSCHGTRDEDKKPSLANASHRSCVSCHLKRIDQQLDSGPVLCVGCHDAQHRAGIKQLEDIPRLVRGQPDSMWVFVPDGRSKVVSFNHLAHEQHSQACSECHHQSLKKCSQCHTLRGAPEGDGLNLARAFHMTPSKHSCVGCHRSQAAGPKCAGCHTTAMAEMSERTCSTCHSGPVPTTLGETPSAPATDEVALLPLPACSDDFPEEVTIDVMVQSYEASRLPHRKIVDKLDAAIRESSLARVFHGSAEAMCSGCHHHSPAGSRPPQCRACHGSSAHPTRDLPGLKAAYHRQCIGCHQRMGIDKQGCTDCHAEREEQS